MIAFVDLNLQRSIRTVSRRTDSRLSGSIPSDWFRLHPERFFFKKIPIYPIYLHLEILSVPSEIRLKINLHEFIVAAMFFLSGGFRTGKFQHIGVVNEPVADQGLTNAPIEKTVN